MAEKKKAKVTAVRSSTTSKSAKEAAYGKREYDYEKPQKPKKGSETYEYGNKAIRNTKFYSDGREERIGTMAKTLKGLGKAKEKDLTKRAVYTTRGCIS